ncbi:MAG: hypothetical protein IJE53_01240 [Bacilli bacterium]|nr:hypothetical protein [Bacilli bacterium]
MTKLLIKYQDSYICEKSRNEINFINIPMYYPNNEPFSNLSIFITLFATNHLSPDYSSNKKLNEIEWSTLFEEYFLPEYLKEVDKDTYIYDIDQLLKDYPTYKEHYESIASSLTFPLTIKHPVELRNKEETLELTEETLYDWRYPLTTINNELERFIDKRHKERTDNDCLLLYSGGKDSTLAAIRLYNSGYNVHFIHFDNGHMRDQDKPYLTFQETFGQKDGFYFDYELNSVNTKELFEEYFNEWPTALEDDPFLLSEIRCLSCRMAMYTKVLQIAKERGYKYIAEGARISQKFMLEQLPIISRLKDLASSYGIKLIFPVLYVDDDQQEIEELLANGYSSKTWESKCLIGKPAKDKSQEDERVITDYYDTVLEPAIQKKLKYKKD